jgi:hypothetical protein
MALSASRTGHHPINDVGGATSTSAGSPPITQITFLTCRAQYPGGPNRCVSVSSLFARPSPVNRRVGIHDFTFEACSSFTRVTACKIARPPKGGLLFRGSGPASYPTKPLGSYHVSPTTTWVDPPSTGDLRRWGALLTGGWVADSSGDPDERALPVVNRLGFVTARVSDRFSGVSSTLRK